MMMTISQTQEAIIMISRIEPILDELRPCFSRQAAFEWFVIIILGLLIRCDHLGVTSIVRWLFLSPNRMTSSCTFSGRRLGNSTCSSLSGLRSRSTIIR